MNHKIFFSYSRADGSAFALKLALDLKEKGFDVWIDQEDIRAGSEWDIEIEKALETCDCLLFIETEKSVTSNNVLDEVYYALEQRKKVIPLIIVDSKTPFRLQRLQHIDFTKNYKTGLALLINELEGNTPTAAVTSAEGVTIIKLETSFLKKYKGAILIAISLVVFGAIFMITANKPNNIVQINQDGNPVVTDSNARQSNSEPTLPNEDPIGGEPINASTQNANISSGKKTQPKKTNNAVAGATENTAINKQIEPARKPSDTNENVVGDWELTSVEPTGQSSRGYLKIEAMDDQKVSVKSYVQFYYPTNNAMSHLTIFNAFAGCASCLFARDMKLVAEDVALGSRSVKTLKENQPGGEKAGDTIMDASSNKSIRATINLSFIDADNAMVKIERTTPVELPGELIVEPFVYSFRFKKRQ